MEDLRSRGIKALPVTIIDDKEVIIGYFPKKLIPAFNLDVKVDLSGKTEWLADKYEQILSAASRATPQFSQEQLDMDVPWRPWTGRKTADPNKSSRAWQKPRPEMPRFQSSPSVWAGPSARIRCMSSAFP